MATRAARGRLAVAGALLATGLAALDASAATAAATPRVLHGSVVTRLAPGARVLHPLSPSSRISFAVVLGVRHAAELRALAAAVHDPGSAAFHRFLSPRAFAARFGATAAQVRAVESWLRAEGIAPTRVSQDGLVVSATARSGTVAAALRTSFSVVALPSGRLAYANRTAPTVPATVAGLVRGIVGLDNLAVLHDHLARPRRHHASSAGAPSNVRSVGHLQRGPRACSAAAASAWSYGSFTADGIASYYGMAPLYGLGDLGAGVHVAIAEFESNAPSDIAAYQRCFHTTTAVHYLPQPGFTDSGAGQGEAALDIENVIGIAPRATVDVYQAANTDAADLAMFSAMVSSGAQAISTSWGSCEPETTPSLMTAEQTILQQAQVQGQVVFAASGDAGSTDCFPSDVNSANDSQLFVDDPASQPYVIGVGGTTATSKGERVWNDGGGGGGGGVSTVECMPTYQSNSNVHGVLDGAYTQANVVTCPTAPSYLREVPDVSAAADPSTGYTVYWGGSWTSIGGTSAGAPLWAAAAALVNASPYCTSLGAVAAVTPESLYALAASKWHAAALRDVTKGNNALSSSGYTGLLYPAHVGYDEASGLGTPSVTADTSARADELFRPGLASLLCGAAAAQPLVPAVTDVVPRRVASGRPTRVTIVGTGFWTVPGAVRVAIGGEQLNATCPSPTRCFAVLPGLRARTDHLRVLDQGVTESPGVAGDLVTFVAAPRVVGLTPTRGRGGTWVVIHGSGFTGAVSVRFGSREVSSVRVVSPTKLVVAAPKGAGSVYVTVAAEGGRSAPAAASRFSY